MSAASDSAAAIRGRAVGGAASHEALSRESAARLAAQPIKVIRHFRGTRMVVQTWVKRLPHVRLTGRRRGRDFG